MTETFYDVLGVSADATPGEIRSAYRERLKESHPDLNEAEDAGAATRRIIRARDVLTDSRERERYDRIGHDAYVGNSEDSVDDGDVSAAATAARDAGWANESGDQERHASSSRAHKSKRRRDRRQRERAASERVNRTTAAGERNEQSGNGSGKNAQRAESRSPDGGATATAEDIGGTAGIGQSWSNTEGFSVRQRHDAGLHRSRLFPASQSLSLLGMTFLLYPVLVFSTVFPPFPLVVNVVVGICTIAVVGYLQSIPEVGVVVFGVWSLVTPIAFLLFGVELVSLVGIIALTGTWLPLGLSVLTLSLVRP